MSFDITASNTGLNKGACALWEKKMGRNLLHLACRHYIHELIISGLFNELFGPSTGPNISLFQRFQKSWTSIKKSKFRALEDERMETEKYQLVKDDTIQFLKKH